MARIGLAMTWPRTGLQLRRVSALANRDDNLVKRAMLKHSQLKQILPWPAAKGRSYCLARVIVAA
jgi:hypothetical protein